jgi:hypothetical protein
MDAMAPGLITDLPSEPSGCERFETAIPVSAGSSLFQVGLVIKWTWSRRVGLTRG